MKEHAKVVLILLCIVILLGLLIPRASSLPQVKALEFPVTLQKKPGSNSQTVPWGIERIHAPDAWSTSTGESIQVAVLDTGIDPKHEDLKGQVVWGICVVGTKVSTNPRD